MKFAFPVEKEEGLESTVYGHFGSASTFIVVDSASDAFTAVHNSDMHHGHGMCSPLKALGGTDVDAVVVGGIGGGALQKLNQLGIRVYRAQDGTVRNNLQLLKENKLTEYTPHEACGGHGHGAGGCAH